MLAASPRSQKGGVVWGMTSGGCGAGSAAGQSPTGETRGTVGVSTTTEMPHPTPQGPQGLQAPQGPGLLGRLFPALCQNWCVVVWCVAQAESTLSRRSVVGSLPRQYSALQPRPARHSSHR